MSSSAWAQGTDALQPCPTTDSAQASLTPKPGVDERHHATAASLGTEYIDPFSVLKEGGSAVNLSEPGSTTSLTPLVSKPTPQKTQEDENDTEKAKLYPRAQTWHGSHRDVTRRRSSLADIAEVPLSPNSTTDLQTYGTEGSAAGIEGQEAQAGEHAPPGEPMTKSVSFFAYEACDMGTDHGPSAHSAESRTHSLRRHATVLVDLYIVPLCLHGADTANMIYLVANFFSKTKGEFDITPSGLLFEITICLVLSLDLLCIAVYFVAAVVLGEVAPRRPRLYKAALSGMVSTLLFITGIIVEVNPLLAKKYNRIPELQFTNTAWATGSVLAVTYFVVGLFISFALWASAGVYAINVGLGRSGSDVTLRRTDTLELHSRQPI